MKPDNYQLWEGVSLRVGPNGPLQIEAPQGKDRPDLAQVRQAVKVRYGISITLGAWKEQGANWVCPVSSSITAKKK